MQRKKAKVQVAPPPAEAADIDALVERFANAPDDALLDQEIVAALRNCSQAKLERERCVGGGPKYIKDGRRCLYRKRDVLAYLDENTVASTSEYGARTKHREQRLVAKSKQAA
jgi:hypothetical protein